MLVINTQKQLKNHLGELRKEGTKSIGLVPTMGALHAGHLSLVESCIKSCEITVVSIFVNPTQFNDPADFASYPSTLDRDLELLKGLDVDTVFVPNVEEIYDRKEVHLNMNFGGLQATMEGAYREGHFEGVGLVVSKFFNIVKPDKAFFGEKDFQQLAVIRELNRSLSFGIEIMGVPIVREPSGLAMSSRNERLSEVGREQASMVYRSLCQARDLLQGGESIEVVKSNIGSLFDDHKDITLDYFEIANVNSLEPVRDLNRLSEGRLFIAAFIEGVRLIDNLTID